MLLLSYRLVKRAMWVAAQCGENAELRDRVEALLAAHDDDSTWGGTGADSLRVSEIRPIISGRYELGGRIGSGSFGVVYQAKQLRPVCREVAVKMIKPGMDTEEVLDRFARPAVRTLSWNSSVVCRSQPTATRIAWE